MGGPPFPPCRLRRGRTGGSARWPPPGSAAGRSACGGARAQQGRGSWRRRSAAVAIVV
ncbi:unnamed protein product, partial [Prorocentrum cordatum]